MGDLPDDGSIERLRRFAVVLLAALALPLVASSLLTVLLSAWDGLAGPIASKEGGLVVVGWARIYVVAFPVAVVELAVAMLAVAQLLFLDKRPQVKRWVLCNAAVLLFLNLTLLLPYVNALFMGEMYASPAEIVLKSVYDHTIIIFLCAVSPFIAFHFSVLVRTLTGKPRAIAVAQCVLLCCVPLALYAAALLSIERVRGA